MRSERMPPRERGRPARTTLAQPHPSLPPGSTGNGARIPLQPSPGVCCRQGGRVPLHGETERPPNAEDAGGTPALPEGRLFPSFLLREKALPLPISRMNRTRSRCVASRCPPGSAGVPPAQHWHSLTRLLHPARPATAPRFRFSRAHGVPGGRAAVCRITGKLSGHPTQRMRAGRPRSRRGASFHPSCSARRHCPCR